MIGIVIPTRGDRKQFLQFAKKQIKMQTMQPDKVVIVNDKPLTEDIDIKYRYKKGFKKLSDCDIIFMIEDDDWYNCEYIEWMYSKWVKYGKPDLFGIAETYYYNILSRRYKHMIHKNRSSAFCTMVNPKALDKFDWGKDNDPFLDLLLWRQIKGIAINYDQDIYTIGIKHNIGKTGGNGHQVIDSWKSGEFIRNIIDKESLEFYNRIIK